MFLAGCIGNSLTRFDPATGKKTLELRNLKSMVNTQTGSLALNIQDGNFVAKLLVIDSNVADSPESATAIGSAITEVMTGGASKVAEKAVENLTNE
jgi:hypothetical protein